MDWERDQTGIRFGCEAPRGVQVTTALRVPAVAHARPDGGLEVEITLPGVP